MHVVMNIENSLFGFFYVRFIFFSRTTGPFSAKLAIGTKNPKVRGIQVCSNERPAFFPMEDKYIHV